MPDTIERNKDVDVQQPSRARKWLWFFGLYFAGLLVTAGVVYFFRGLIELTK